MVVNRDEVMRGLRKEAGGLTSEVNAPYRNLMLSAVELIEMDANQLKARAQQVKELEKTLRKLAKESEHLVNFFSECTVSQDLLMNGGPEAAGKQLREDLIRRMTESGAISVATRPDIIRGGRIFTAKVTAMITKLPQKESEGV